MLKLKQAVIVEGRYDKAKLASLIDAEIITTGGFDVFRSREKLDYIRRLAEKRGIIILTDSDAAGFRIRGYLAGAVPPGQVTHVYIPDVFGKERRKAQPSAEGKLGVEGISAGLLLEAFTRAGVCVEAPEAQGPQGQPVTKADLVQWGLSGGENSAALRRRVLKALRLPARMSAKALLSAVNSLYSREEFVELLETITVEGNMNTKL